MKKILLGGSPCTFWSVAQHNGRETEPSGLGWELFLNYCIAKQKFKPDFFFYENNESASKAIKSEISKELGVELAHGNSAMVSAQVRRRIYAFNWECALPEDRGIFLKDILESRALWKTTEESNGTIRIGQLDKGSQGDRVYSIDGKAVALKANGVGWGAKGGLYAVPVGVGYRNRREADGKLYRRFETSGIEKSNALTTVTTDSMIAEPLIYAKEQEKAKPNQIYEVKDGEYELKGRKYKIRLADGMYIIREPSITEAERLQTLPDGYTKAIAMGQRRKCLGNGWTAEIVIHFLKEGLKNIPRDEKIVVLSMYDGIATGRYCLEQLGFTNIKYYAYEIDKPAIAVALDNYPDIIEMGDAFQVREEGWNLGEIESR